MYNIIKPVRYALKNRIRFFNKMSIAKVVRTQLNNALKNKVGAYINKYKNRFTFIRRFDRMIE